MNPATLQFRLFSTVRIQEEEQKYFDDVIDKGLPARRVNKNLKAERDYVSFVTNREELLKAKRPGALTPEHFLNTWLAKDGWYRKLLREAHRYPEYELPRDPEEGQAVPQRPRRRLPRVRERRVLPDPQVRQVLVLSFRLVCNFIKFLTSFFLTWRYCRSVHRS